MTKYYSGISLERGNTALHSDSSSPAIRWLVENGHIVKGMRILDYGAGYGRNSKFLRDEGCHVYSYDPYNGTDTGGWYDVALSLPHPESKFDLLLTCFVLNVIPKRDENRIIGFGDHMGVKQIHITRNKDLLDSIHKAVTNQSPVVMGWFHDHRHDLSPMTGDWCDIQKLCNFGVKTSRGFQRDVHLWDDHKMCIVHETYGYKIFAN